MLVHDREMRERMEREREVRVRRQEEERVRGRGKGEELDEEGGGQANHSSRRTVEKSADQIEREEQMELQLRTTSECLKYVASFIGFIP